VTKAQRISKQRENPEGKERARDSLSQGELMSSSVRNDYALYSLPTA
jgi:hypothetical protein